MNLLVSALEFASRIHAGQTWKERTLDGVPVPFLHHPMGVCAFVLKYGGTDVQGAAALLHDTIAEPGVTESLLREKFGESVSWLVSAFTDPPSPKGEVLDWRASKQAYLAKLRGLNDPEALLVVACEELHEALELLHDIRHQGIAVWKRYPVHQMEVFWYFRELLSIFVSQLSALRFKTLVGDFGAAVKSLKEVVFEGATWKI